MRVRELDGLHDWTFGKGRNNYLKENAAVAQNINTRLNSFLGDCFFDLGAGIDWFKLLGGKDEAGARLAIATTILNTPEVKGIILLNTSLDPYTRTLTVVYNVQTVYSSVSAQFNFSLDQGA